MILQQLFEQAGHDFKRAVSARVDLSGAGMNINIPYMHTSGDDSEEIFNYAFSTETTRRALGSTEYREFRDKLATEKTAELSEISAQLTESLYAMLFMVMTQKQMELKDQCIKKIDELAKTVTTNDTDS